MRRVWSNLIHPRPAQAHRLIRWVFFAVGLPLVGFILVSVFWPKTGPAVSRVTVAQRWVEPLGSVVFDEAHLSPLLHSKPDFAQAAWQAVEFPDTNPLPASVDLPAQAPVARVWFRIQLPPDALAGAEAANSTGIPLALMGNRMMGGPWAVWRDGQLLQTNAADWRIGWNIPCAHRWGSTMRARHRPKCWYRSSIPRPRATPLAPCLSALPMP